MMREDGQGGQSALRKLVDRLHISPRSQSEVSEHFDLLGVARGSSIRIAVKHLSSGRLADIRGRLAEALLRAQREPFDGITLLAIHGPRFGEQAWETARDFVAEFGSEKCGAALLDDDGGFRIAVPAWDLDLDEGPRPRASIATSGRLFTDLNSWLIKVLILDRAPERYRVSSKASPKATQADLARAADVSPYTVNKLVHLLVERGHFSSPRHLQLLDVERLLSDWLADTAARIPDRRPARSIFGDGRPWDASFGSRLPGRGALGGFHAAHGLDVVVRPSLGLPEVHVEGDLQQWMDVLDLEPCSESEAQLVLRSPAAPECVFRGARMQADSEPLPVVDILQVALDVVDRPARGREQAEHIVRLVLGWWTR